MEFIIIAVLLFILFILVKRVQSEKNAEENTIKPKKNAEENTIKPKKVYETVDELSDLPRHSFKPNVVNSDWEKKMRRRALGNNIAMLFKADGDNYDIKMAMVVSYLSTYYSRNEALAIKQCVKDNLSPKCHNGLHTWLGSNLNYGERLALLELMIDIAKLNNGINQAEWQALSELMGCLLLENIDVKYVKHKYAFTSMPDVVGDANSSSQQAVDKRTVQLAEAYRVLGLDYNASAEDVKISFRRLSKIYHPDTVQDENLKKVLTEKFKEISSAYNLLTD